MIYLVIGIILILLALDELYNYSFNKSRVVSIIVGLILILLAGLRSDVGTDWDSYYEYYLYGINGIEIGYAYLNNLFGKDLGIQYNVFLVIMNLIAIRFMMVSSWRLSPLPVLALLLFFCDLYLYFNLSGFRQALATSFSCFAITYAFGERRNLLKFLLWVVIAACFHITAVIVFITYFIPQRRFTKKEYIISIILFMFFSTFIYFASSFFTGIFADKAEFYLEVQEQALNIQTLFLIGAIRRGIPLFLVLYFGRKDYFKNSLSCYLFNLYIIGLGIFLSSYLVSPDIGVRMSSYFIIMEIFMIGNLIYNLRGRKFALNISLLIIILVAVYKITTYMNNPDYAYQSIL